MKKISIALRSATLAVLATSAAMLLAACGKTESSAAATTGSASTSAPAAPPEARGQVSEKANAKLNAYAEAYNKLIGTFGLPETRERYYKANIPKKSAKDSVSITTGWVDVALEKFKTGRALPSGGLDELDKTADALIASLDKLVVQLKALDVYYTSKAYREDDLARGKAEDPAVRASFEASASAMDAFNAVLSREQKKRQADTLARLKANGDVLTYESKLALSQGEDIISLFNSQEDMSSAEKYKQADGLVAQLDKTLAGQRQHFTEAKEQGKNPSASHESMGSSLVSLIGSYRDMKQSKNPKDYNRMVKDYNNAVDRSNRL